MLPSLVLLSSPSCKWTDALCRVAQWKGSFWCRMETVRAEWGGFMALVKPALVPVMRQLQEILFHSPHDRWWIGSCHSEILFRHLMRVEREKVRSDKPGFRPSCPWPHGPHRGAPHKVCSWVLWGHRTEVLTPCPSPGHPPLTGSVLLSFSSTALTYR